MSFRQLFRRLALTPVVFRVRPGTHLDYFFIIIKNPTLSDGFVDSFVLWVDCYDARCTQISSRYYIRNVIFKNSFVSVKFSSTTRYRLDSYEILGKFYDCLRISSFLILPVNCDVNYYLVLLFSSSSLEVLYIYLTGKKIIKFPQTLKV